MAKSKYIKPQCEDIFLVKGSAECGPGSSATGPPPGGCKIGDAAINNCGAGGLVVARYCGIGNGQQGCSSGDGATACGPGNFANFCDSGAGVN